MPVYGGSSASGKQKKPRKAKRAKRPTYSTPSAILGGKGVKKTEKARKSYDKSVRKRARRKSPSPSRGPSYYRSLRRRNLAEQKISRTLEGALGSRLQEDDDGGLLESAASLSESLTGVERGESVGRAKVKDVPALAMGVTPLGKAKTAVKLGQKIIGGGEKAATAGAKVQKLGQKASKLEKAGKPRRATRARKKEAKAATKSESKARKNRTTLDRATKGETGVKAGAKRQWKRRQPASLHKAGRQVKRRRRAQTIAEIGAGSTAAATIGAGTLQTTGEALVDDIKEGKPLRTLKTTARVIPGMPSAVVGDVIDVAKYAAGDEAAGKRALSSYEDYIKTVSRVAQGGEKGVKAVQRDVGLVPVISGGLTAAGLAKPFRAPKPKADMPRKARKLDERARTGGSKPERAAAEAKRGELKQGRRQAHRERTEEARRKARTQHRIEALHEEDLKVEGRGRKRLDRRVRKLSRRPITKDVSYADAIQLLAREGLYDTDPEFALRELRARRAALREPGKPIHENDVATRDVMDAILKNPHILSDPALTGAIKGFAKARRIRSTERHAERTGKDQDTPDPLDERPRLLHLQRAEDIRTADERVPHELRGKTKVTPKRGQDAEKAIRAEAKAFRKKALRLKHQGKREAAEEAKLEARAREAVINRARKAEALDRRASQLEAGKPARKGEPSPAQMRAEAVALRRQVEADNARLRGETEAETQARISEKGYSQPIYFRESDVSDKGNLNVAAGNDYLGSKVPPKEQFRTGRLAEEGRIDESGSTLMENFHRERIATEMRQHVRETLDDGLFDPGDGKGLVRTGTEWRKLEREGKIPPGMEPFPVQEWGRVLQRGSFQEAQQLLDDPLMRDVREAKGLEGKKYGLIGSARKQEFRAQMDNVSRELRAARVIGRIQTSAMLATSPLWFQFQLVASPIVAAFRHPNPARAAKAGYRMLKEYRKLPKRDRIRFESEFGGTSADVFDMRDIEAGIRPQTVRGMTGAANVARQSPAGRLLNSIKKGGPLISGNRRFEARVRTFVALIELDKQVNPPRVMRAAKSIAKAQDEVWTQMQALRGKSLEEQLAFLRSKEGRAGTKRIRDNVDDGLGNWTALSRHERGPAAAAVFYPFLRFSAKWLALTSPRDRPLTYAFAMNAAQQNAQELDERGEPSFFTDWGQVVMHGEEDSTLALGRVAPGSNALVESIGQGEFNLASLARLTQPAIGGSLLALAGQDAFGEDSDLNPLEAAAATALNLSPLTRSLTEKIDPKSDISEAFAMLEDREDRGYLENLFVPDLVNPASELKKTNQLAEALDRSKSPDEGDWIAKALDGGRKPDAREFAKRFVKQSEKASAGRDDVSAIMRDLGLDNPNDQKWIDAFFSAIASVRTKRAYRKENPAEDTSIFGDSSTGGSIFAPSSGKKKGSIFGDSSGGGSIFK